MVRATVSLIAAAAVAGSAYAAPIAVPDSETATCVVDNLQDYQQQFLAGSNSCEVRPKDEKMLFSRYYKNVQNWNGMSSLNPWNAKPFVFAAGATTDEPGCVQEWLNAGHGNTDKQWDVMLDIGYSTEAMCTPTGEANATASTLLVWENDANDAKAVWATWDNVVPHMANLFGVQNPQVTAATMHSKTFADWQKEKVIYNNSYWGFSDFTNYYWSKDVTCDRLYAANSAYMQEAMSEPTGLQFRAALYACFSFFDVFMGNGYTYDAHIQGPGKCREYLFPVRNIQLVAQPQLMQYIGNTQVDAASAQQDSTISLLRRDAPEASVEPSLLAGMAVVPTLSDAAPAPAPLAVLPLNIAIGAAYLDKEACPRPGSPSLVF